MILERILCCECTPGKIFKNNTTFKVHLNSKKHLNWVSKNEIKNYKKTSVDYENNIFNYKLKLKRKEEEYNKLNKLYEKKKILINFYIKKIIILIIFLNIKYSLNNR